jgi:hypothetical protein
MVAPVLAGSLLATAGMRNLDAVLSYSRPDSLLPMR